MYVHRMWYKGIGSLGPCGQTSLPHGDISAAPSAREAVAVSPVSGAGATVYRYCFRSRAKGLASLLREGMSGFRVLSCRAEGLRSFRVKGHRRASQPGVKKPKIEAGSVDTKRGKVPKCTPLFSNHHGIQSSTSFVRTN